MEKISYKLDMFEGPMDLLLHLINKRKLNINDVPIIELVEQYISYVRQFQEENMEVASEFLEMAARLVYIKTVSLLPVHEEADKLAEELRGELSDYLDCQIVAGKLSEKAFGFDYYWRTPQEFEADMTYTRLHEPVEIYKAYLSAVGKGKRKLPPPVEAFSGIIERKIVSVTSRITFILRRLANARRQKFVSFFDVAESRSEMVATFMALLALVKAKRITVEGNGDQVDVVLLKKRTEAERH